MVVLVLGCFPIRFIFLYPVFHLAGPARFGFGADIYGSVLNAVATAADSVDGRDQRSECPA